MGTPPGPIFGWNRTVWKLIVLDKNTWKQIAVCKQMIVIWWEYLLVGNRNTWNHVNMSRLIVWRIVISNHIIAHKKKTYFSSK